MTRHTRPILALVTMVLLAPCAGRAQPSPGPDPGGPAGDRARTFLLLRMTEALALSDEKALALSRVLRGVDEQRRQLRERRHDVEERIRTALEKSPTDAAALGTLVEEANGIDHEIAGLQERSTREAQKQLTVEQQARLVLLRPQLQQEVRGAFQRRMMDGRDGGGDDRGPRRFVRPDGPMQRGPRGPGGRGGAPADDLP
ncbi:MAG: hypothetical protein U0807_01785 [Candidatus Binatia bacterium]